MTLKVQESTQKSADKVMNVKKSSPKTCCSSNEESAQGQKGSKTKSSAITNRAHQEQEENAIAYANSAFESRTHKS